MTTVSQIVTRAFRKLGISGVGDNVTDDEMAEGVDALNMMIHGWALRGTQWSWSDQAAGDTFNLPSQYHEGVVYLLAARLSPDYQTPPTFDADDWFRAIQASDMVIEEAAMPSGLTRMPSQFARQKNAYWGDV